MNRRTAAARARELIRQRIAQNMNQPAYTVLENGDVWLSGRGDKGMLIRLARSEGGSADTPGLEASE